MTISTYMVDYVDPHGDRCTETVKATDHGHAWLQVLISEEDGDLKCRPVAIENTDSGEIEIYDPILKEHITRAREWLLKELSGGKPSESTT